MSSTERHAQRPVRVCGALRTRIISGAYCPGERITEQSLAEEFGISRIPVREALRVLEAQGYVRIQPQHGTFVRAIDRVEAELLGQ